MAILVNNQQDKVELPPETEKGLVALAESVLRRAGKPEAEVGITLADDAYLRQLNHDYRGLDVATDVLSFALQETAGAEPSYQENGPELLGDVIVSLEKATRQAEEYGHPFQRELSYLTLHGLLHLLGYDHLQPDQAERMRAMEEEILADYGLMRGEDAPQKHD